jgi:hypothetical protein
MMRQPSSKLSALLAGIAVAATVSCDSAVAPVSVEGVYVLRAIGDKPVPAIVFSGIDATGYPVTRISVADTIRLFAGNEGSKGTTVTESLVHHGPRAGRWFYSSLEEFSYNVSGATIEITTHGPACPPDSNCIVPRWTARLVGGELVLFEGTGLSTSYIYRRIE